MRLRVSLLLGLCICLISTIRLSAGEVELAHAIYVKVNGRTITKEQVAEVVNYLVKREYNGVKPEDEEVLQNLEDAALRDLVRSHLIHFEAESKGLRSDPNARKYAIMQSGLKPEEVTVSIRRILEADDLFNDLMMSQGTPVPEPSPRDIKNFFNENREEFRTNAMIIIRSFFLQQDPRRSQSFIKNKAEEVLRQVEAVPFPRRTDAFDAIAKEKSEDMFAEFGGLLTGDSPERWIPRDFENISPEGYPMFPPVMYEEMRQLKKPGEVRLVMSSEGAHIVYCEDVRGGRSLPWDEAKRIVEYVLKTRMRNERLRSWLNEVYDRSDVRWHDGAVYEKSDLTEVLLPSERSGGA